MPFLLLGEKLPCAPQKVTKLCDVAVERGETTYATSGDAQTNSFVPGDGGSENSSGQAVGRVIARSSSLGHEDKSAQMWICG